MARSFRFYGKKRGSRRTGSKTLGSAGEVAFFAVFLLVGCGGLAAWFWWLLVPEWRVNHEFVEHTCQVLDKRIAEKPGDEGTVYRPEVQIEYEVRGRKYVAWAYDIHQAYSSGKEDQQAALDAFVVNAADPVTYPCWYDPADPAVVVLVRQYHWWIWLVFAVPVSFLLIGGGGLIYRLLHWGKSTERRAAMAARARQRDLFNGNGSSQHRLPAIPDGANITDSPGTTLRFRLPIGASPGWMVVGSLLACLFWNGIVSVFVAIAVRGHLAGDPDWLLTIFLVPFVLVGLALIAFFVRQLLVTTGVGPTLVEISDHPLHPGEQFELFISQSGRLAINSIEVLLVCEEEATYRQGTDTRTETREVHRQQVFRREGFEVRRGLPFESRCEIRVPAGAMHSFKSDHNEVNWKIVLEGDVAGWPNYKRSFPLIVHPANGRTDG